MKTCRGPATATSGAQGLVASEYGSDGRGVFMNGSSSQSPFGSATGPDGLPVWPGASARFIFGLLLDLALPAGFSMSPSLIHALMMFKSASGIFVPEGGIFGSSRWAVTLKSLLASALPASTMTPEEPPFINAL